MKARTKSEMSKERVIEKESKVVERETGIMSYICGHAIIKPIAMKVCFQKFICPIASCSFINLCTTDQLDLTFFTFQLDLILRRLKKIST